MKQLKELFSEVNISDLLGFIKSQIISAAKQIIPGEEKKAFVVETTITWLMKLVKAINFPGIDKIWDEIIEEILKVVIPILVQFIYDQLIADKIDI